MKTIQVEIADENVEFFLELVEDLRLHEKREVPKEIPASQQEEVLKRLAGAKSEDAKPMEAYFEKHRGKTIQVEVPDSKVDFFMKVLDSLDLTEGDESASIPEWHKEEIDKALAEDNTDDGISAEDFIAQLRRERGLQG